MKILKLHYRIFKVLGLVQQNEASEMYGFVNILHICTVIFIILSTTLPSIAYVWVNVADLAKTTEATYSIAGMSMPVGMYWFLAISKPKLRMVLDELQNIVDDSAFS